MHKKIKISTRKLNAIETKNKLLQSALYLFSHFGFDKVTVEDITRSAGVAKGTFYSHFATKEQVLVEQFSKIENSYKEVYDNRKPSETAEQLALNFIDAMCKFCCDEWGLDFLKVVYSNQISLGSHPLILLNKDRLFYHSLEDIVKLGQDRGEFTKDLSVEEQVYLFASICRSLLYEWCLHNGSYNLREAGQKSCKIVLKYIRAAPDHVGSDTDLK